MTTEYTRKQPDVSDESQLPLFVVPQPMSLVEPFSNEYYRLERRGYKAEEKDAIDLDHTPSISVGPACDLLYPFLCTDPREYTSPLATIEMREMIASTAFAVFNDAEKFGAIIGEDTSGRFPALIIGKAINIIRERKGLPKARRLFVSGRAGMTTPEYEASGDHDRALLITEYICTGTSVSEARDALYQAGFLNVDVAALERYHDDENNISLAKSNYYFGDYRTYTASAGDRFYGIPSWYKGVIKSDGEPHANRASYGPYGTTKLNALRRDIDYFAEELVDIWTIFQENAVVQE